MNRNENQNANQNQFEPKVKTEISLLTILFAALVILLLAGGGGWYYLVQTGQDPLKFLGLSKIAPSAIQTQTETEKEATEGAIPEPPIIETATEMAEVIVRTFYDNLAMSVPPLSDPIAPQMALDLMTERAKKTINLNSDNISGELLKFAGVQSLPDQGFTVIKTSEAGNTITVETTWTYSSGPVTKTFTLMQEEGNWRIDSVK